MRAAFWPLQRGPGAIVDVVVPVVARIIAGNSILGDSHGLYDTPEGCQFGKTMHQNLLEYRQNANDNGTEPSVCSKFGRRERERENCENDTKEKEESIRDDSLRSSILPAGRTVGM